MLAIRARGITRRFGDVIALDHLDLDVEQGRIHGLVGPNGAGKTTLMGLLLGLAAADSGTLDVLGTRVGGIHLAPPGVSGFVDGPALYPSLTARKNLVALTRLWGDRSTAVVDEVLDQVGLRDVSDDRVDGFSLGMRQRLGLAAALLAGPRLLVLDEPANGLDPAGKRHVQGVLTRLAEEGTTVVLSSHRMEDVETLCSEVTVMAAGRAVYSGPLTELTGREQQVDYRLVASDLPAARRLAEHFGSLTLLPAPGHAGSAPILVRASVDVLHAFQLRLAGEGVSVRELTPVTPPLEAAYLALTEGAVA